MEAANGVEIPYAASIVFRAPGINPSGVPRCGTALRSSRATDEDEADHGAWSNILCYPNSPNMHAREKEQIRDWLFKGPKERAARLIPMDFHWKIGIFQTLLLELADEDPPTAVVLSFPFDCLG